MTKYQELSALLEVSTILAGMNHESADEVFRQLSGLSKDRFREEAYKIVSKNQPTTGVRSAAA
jgi:hypothetical protein